MKRIFVSFLIAIMCFACAFSFMACGSKKGETKIGLGVYSTDKETSDASSAANGKTFVTHTAAAIITDADGKIIDCMIDTAEVYAEYTSGGKFVSREYKTKGELGDEYNMKLGGAKLEWYEQRDAFCKTVKGKTLSEVKALVVGEGKGNQEVVSAGCTIEISDFVRAITDAFGNMKKIDGDDSGDMKLTVKTAVDGKDASDSSRGSAKVKTDIVVKLGSETLDKTIEFTSEFDTSGKTYMDNKKSLMD